MTHHIRSKAVFNWSGGKDSALALHQVLQEDRYEIVALLTTVNRSTRRSSMHGIPTELLQRQADSIGIPLYVVDLTPKGNMEDYETAMRGAVEHFKAIGAGRFIFGDIFLHDCAHTGKTKLAPYGIEVIEPLWGRTSGQIMEEFLASGLETVIVTTTADVLGREFIGRRMTRNWSPTCPKESIPAGKTANTIRSVTAGECSARECLSRSGLRCSKVIRSGSTTVRNVSIPTGSPT